MQIVEAVGQIGDVDRDDGDLWEESRGEYCDANAKGARLMESKNDR
jgi:hypothetical protein